MKKILDNGHIMHYNNHCSAGVAHLVERDLAKVEVASSSLVARSKKKHHPNRVVFFLHLPAGQRLEQGTSEARETCRGHVLVPACVWRPGWAASEPRRPLQKNNTIPTGWCFFAFTGPPAMCSPSCRQHKSAVLLRRFCFARKMEQRERYSIICCTFFCLQPLCRRLHRR